MVHIEQGKGWYQGKLIGPNTYGQCLPTAVANLMRLKLAPTHLIERTINQLLDHPLYNRDSTGVLGKNLETLIGDVFSKIPKYDAMVVSFLRSEEELDYNKEHINPDGTLTVPSPSIILTPNGKDEPHASVVLKNKGEVRVIENYGSMTLFNPDEHNTWGYIRIDKTNLLRYGLKKIGFK